MNERKNRKKIWLEGKKKKKEMKECPIFHNDACLHDACKYFTIYNGNIVKCSYEDEQRKKYKALADAGRVEPYSDEGSLNIK